jgi:hypothetical protein
LLRSIAPRETSRAVAASDLHIGPMQEPLMSRSLQPTLVRGVFGVFLSLLVIGGATARAFAIGLQDEAGVAQCNAVTRASATLSDRFARDAS